MGGDDRLWREENAQLSMVIGCHSRNYCHLSPGIFKALVFIFSSLCAWYSGYLLAELIPEVPLSNTLYSIRSIGERPVLKGEC